MALFHVKNFVQSLYDEGLLDSQFAQIQCLQDENNPEFVSEVICLFCQDVERIITELNISLSHQDLDYTRMDFFINQLSGSTSSIGAHKLKLACADIRQALDDKSKERCLQVLNVIKREYCVLRNKFQILVQLEKGTHTNGFQSPVTGQDSTIGASST